MKSRLPGQTASRFPFAPWELPQGVPVRSRLWVQGFKAKCVGYQLVATHFFYFWCNIGATILDFHIYFVPLRQNMVVLLLIKKGSANL
jgi:hypothetical protein